MLTETPVPSSSSQTQTWLTILSGIAAAVGALLAKKRFTRRQQPAPPKPDLITRTEFHQALDGVRDKLDAVHKDLASAITTQGAIIEKRLDALESAVARLDERTKPKL
jgi:hypothetical protein